MTPHLLCYQWLAVEDYGFALDAVNMGHPRPRRASLDFRSIRVNILINFHAKFISYQQVGYDLMCYS